MGYSGSRLFTVDLGSMHVVQPCASHAANGDGGEPAGWQPDCDACAKTPEREIQVPHLHGYWVELRNPQLLSYGEKKRLYAPAESDTAEALRARRERIVTGLVTAWNLTPADEPDNATVLPLPKDDAGALDRAPDIVDQVMVGLSREQRRAERGLPKAPVTG